MVSLRPSLFYGDIYISRPGVYLSAFGAASSVVEGSSLGSAAGEEAGAGSADAPASPGGGGVACESRPGELAEAGGCSGSTDLGLGFCGAYSDEPGNWVSVTNCSRIRRWAGVSDLGARGSEGQHSVGRKARRGGNAYLGIVTLNFTTRSPWSFL